MFPPPTAGSVTLACGQPLCPPPPTHPPPHPLALQLLQPVAGIVDPNADTGCKEKKSKAEQDKCCAAAMANGTTLDTFCSKLVAEYACKDVGAVEVQRRCCEVKAGLNVTDAHCATVSGGLQ